MKIYHPSFFDESKRLAALSHLNDPLEELGKHIDFEMFRLVLTETLRKAERKSPTGRKHLDVILMFKALIIQRLFNFSEEQLEFQITDRLSCTRFMGLHIGEIHPRLHELLGFLRSPGGKRTRARTGREMKRIGYRRMCDLSQISAPKFHFKTGFGFNREMG